MTDIGAVAAWPLFAGEIETGMAKDGWLAAIPCGVAPRTYSIHHPTLALRLPLPCAAIPSEAGRSTAPTIFVLVIFSLSAAVRVVRTKCSLLRLSPAGYRADLYARCPIHRRAVDDPDNFNVLKKLTTALDLSDRAWTWNIGVVRQAGQNK